MKRQKAAIRINAVSADMNTRAQRKILKIFPMTMSAPCAAWKKANLRLCRQKKALFPALFLHLLGESNPRCRDENPVS